MTTHLLHRRAILRLIAISLVAASATGCVQRRFTIRSNPPGALVYIDDYEVGTTPVSTDFVYYGTRKIRLVKDGYETLTVLQPVPTPWYEYPLVDFVSENLVPGEIRDERVLDYQLQPQVIVPTEQLLGRAEELRRGSHASAAVPALPPGSPAPLAAPGSPSNPFVPGQAEPIMTPPPVIERVPY